MGEEANILAEESGVTEIRPYRDEDGAALVASGPDASAAAFSLMLSAAGQEVELVDYVECRTLIADEAVLIITLVTEPDVFKSELAAAQVVVDTLALAEIGAVNPLEAYGGWLAAATRRPSVAGPLTGDLDYGPGDLAVERAGVDEPDFYARAVFANPESVPDGLWDIGLGFRDSGDEEQFRLVVDAAGNWFFKDGLGSVISSGTVVDFDASAGGENIIEIVASGDSGYFAFNERLVTEFDLSSRADGGNIFVGAGFFAEDATADGAVAYSDFEIWSLAGVVLADALAPAIDMNATTFTDLLAAATAGAPLAGPTSGDLVQAVGSATVAPAGVDLEDFVTHVTFVNPSDAVDSSWDFGIAFREQVNGDHYRITVSSDGSWEFQIGLQAPLAEGIVPSLLYENGDRNTLRVVVLDGAAGFSVNDIFISQVDVSDLSGTADVWAGVGFHQADAMEGVVTRFTDFSVWPANDLTDAQTPSATPVADIPGTGRQVALQLEEQNGSGVDALAVLSEAPTGLTVTVTARGAVGNEVVVIHDGTCDEPATLPAFLLSDVDATGRSETDIDGSLADLADGAHSIAIHRSAADYADVLACGDIKGEE